MENILNYVKEEKVKLDAYYQRVNEESNARISKVKQLQCDLVEKLKPLETIVIQNMKTTVEPEDRVSDNIIGAYAEIRIKYGSEYTALQGYTTRMDIRVTVSLNKEGPGHHYKLEGASMVFPHKDKQLNMEECLTLIAKFFAHYVKE